MFITDNWSTLELMYVSSEKQAIKTNDNASEESSAKTKRTLENQSKIIEYLKDNGRSKCTDIATYIGLSEARTRAILADMPEVEIMGQNRNRTYRIK